MVQHNDNNTCDKQHYHQLCHYLYIYVQIIKFCCCSLFTLHREDTRPGTCQHTQDGKNQLEYRLEVYRAILTNDFFAKD
jgi:hypothetical protein